MDNQHVKSLLVVVAKAPVPGEVAARISLVHVTDLVAAIIACLQTP